VLPGVRRISDLPSQETYPEVHHGGLSAQDRKHVLEPGIRSSLDSIDTLGSRRSSAGSRRTNVGTLTTTRTLSGQRSLAGGRRAPNAWPHVETRGTRGRPLTPAGRARSTPSIRRITPLLTLLFACLASPAAAQVSTLSGRITDPQGALVAGASVRAAREDGSDLHRTSSGPTGEYRFDRLPDGAFAIEIEKTGFRRSVTLVAIAGAAHVTHDVALEVAGVDDAVVVTASGRPQAIAETSKAITVVDAPEIHARNAATLTDIVRFTPGVQVRDNGGPGQVAQLRIRGLRPDAAAVLVDGLRLRDASTTQGDVTSLLPALTFVAAERVEVLRGSGSSLYGTNAVGGVVNIVSAQGGGPLRAEAQTEAGSHGHYRTRGSVGGSAADGRLSFSAGGLQWNVLDGLDGDDETRSTAAQTRIRYRLGEATNVTARLLASNDFADLNVGPTASGIPAANVPETGIVEALAVAPGAIERANAGGPLIVGPANFVPGRNDPDSRRTSAFHTTAAQLQHVHSAALSVQGTYQRVGTRRTFRNGPAGAGFQSPAESVSQFEGTIDTIDARAIYLPASWMTLSAGYEFEREGYADLQDNNLPGADRVRTEATVTQQAHAIFGAAQLGFLDRRLQVALSGRSQWFVLDSPAFEAVGADNVYARVPLSAPPRALTGDVSAAYLLDASKTKLRAHAGNAYRAPGLYERFGGGFFPDPVSGAIVFSPYGDPRLAPDRYQTFDAGVDQYVWGERLLVSASAFWIDVESLTAFDFSGGIRPDTDPYGRSGGYLNGSGGFSRGVEVGLDARPSATLRLSASYTYTSAETADDITVPDFYKVPGVFAHTATLVATRQWGGRVDTSLDLFHASPAFGSYFAAGRPRAYRYAAFTRVGVTAGCRLTGSSAGSIRAYVRLDNLFDETYYQAGWLSVGRTAAVGVSVGR
jgi:iron complex outermembrane receptor protein